MNKETKMNPMLTLRHGNVPFPGTPLALAVGREESKAAVREAQEANGNLALAALDVESGKREAPYSIGCLGRILNVSPVPGNPDALAVTIDPYERVSFADLTLSDQGFFRARATPVSTVNTDSSALGHLIETALNAFDTCCNRRGNSVDAGKLLRLGLRPDLSSSKEVAVKLPGLALHYLSLGEPEHCVPTELRQAILAESNVARQLELLIEALHAVAS